MIYFLYGTDKEKSRAKLHELLDTLSKKRPQSEIFKINSEGWSEGQFDELLSSQGLFDQKYIVVLDGLLENKNTKSYILDRAENMKVSEQVFLLIEGKTDTPTVKKMEGFSQKTQEFVKPESKKTLSYNIFSITDGLIQKDKRKLWVSYIDLLSKGAVAEEIHGILFWQVKNMIIASRMDQRDTDLSPYAYKNALSGSRNYTHSELDTLSSHLVDMVHKVRTGKGDLDIMLEKEILCM